RRGGGEAGRGSSLVGRRDKGPAGGRWGDGGGGERGGFAQAPRSTSRTRGSGISSPTLISPTPAAHSAPTAMFRWAWSGSTRSGTTPHPPPQRRAGSGPYARRIEGTASPVRGGAGPSAP